MIVGELVEFWSSSGRWKPAVVAPRINWAGELDTAYKSSSTVRLQTGPGVFIVRRVVRNGKVMVRKRRKQ